MYEPLTPTGAGRSRVSSTRWRAEAALAVLFAVVMLAVGGRALWFMSRKPVHEDAASVPSTAAAAPSTRYAEPVEESRRLARALAAGDNLPGLSVAVAVDGEIVWAEGFGWTDVESRTPVTPLTRFRLGALSKPLTAVAAALLHDRGRLDLDAPVQRYVPAYPKKQWKVTMRQLMGDVAGVHRIRGDSNDAMPSQHCASLDEAVAMLADDPLLFEPGTQHRYSIWGWVLVSAAVEGAAGELLLVSWFARCSSPSAWSARPSPRPRALAVSRTGPGVDPITPVQRALARFSPRRRTSFDSARRC